MAGSPEPQSRTLPSVWTTGEAGANIQEALDALETYKKKDPNKGESCYSSYSYGPLTASVYVV